MSTRTFGSKIGHDVQRSVVSASTPDSSPDSTGIEPVYAEIWERAAAPQVTRMHTPQLLTQRDILEKDETTLPLPNPSRQNKDSNLYETFIRRAGFQSSDQAGNGDVLAAGAEQEFRAGAVPEKWRIIITSASPATLWVDPGDSFSFPSEFVTCAANSSASIVVPGRGLALNVKADTANAASITMTATAFAGATADTV